jgi:hypothetical protein
VRIVEDVELLPSDRETARAINSMFFYTGKPCKHGHIAKRRTNKNSCVECIQAIANRYKRSDKARETRLARIVQLKSTGEWERATASRTLKHYYGITLIDYEAMFAAQNGVCAICQMPEVVNDHKTQKPRRLAVDHCHKTRKIRGLLCNACNTALGKLKDNPQLIERAAAYVRNEGELNCR